MRTFPLYYVIILTLLFSFMEASEASYPTYAYSPSTADVQEHLFEHDSETLLHQLIEAVSVLPQMKMHQYRATSVHFLIHFNHTQKCPVITLDQVSHGTKPSPLKRDALVPPSQKAKRRIIYNIYMS